MVRCLKLLKSYGKKDEEDEEENDEEDGGRKLQSESRILERDTLTQAYEISMSELHTTDRLHVFSRKELLIIIGE